MGEHFDVVIVGAGAAGMMCAIEAEQRGRRVLVVEHNSKAGEKIRISGGGRCNFTNVNCSPKNFLSQNPYFSISALERYSQHDFIALVSGASIDYHEKTLGQLFCDGSAQQIIDLLLARMQAAGVVLWLTSEVSEVSWHENLYALKIKRGDGNEDEARREISCDKLVIASGGRSIPKMGASGFGYKVAEQFGLSIVPPRPGLVPLTFDEALLAVWKPLTGTALDVRVSCEAASFSEAMLFTHRGLSGPAVLQVSSYWMEGEEVIIDLLPGEKIAAIIEAARHEHGKRDIQTVLGYHMPKKLAQAVTMRAGVEKPVAEMTREDIGKMEAALHHWRVQPMGSEGYRTAEVTVGGVDTRGLSSKTMEANNQPGLYFIGEVVDVTGWLGGYNFQWAWSSGWVAGQVV